MYIYIYIHIHTYTYIFTHTHTHTHTYIYYYVCKHEVINCDFDIVEGARIAPSVVNKSGP
jgi:hypothetical protein